MQRGASHREAGVESGATAAGGEVVERREHWREGDYSTSKKARAAMTINQRVPSLRHQLAAETTLSVTSQYLESALLSAAILQSTDLASVEGAMNALKLAYTSLGGCEQPVPSAEAALAGRS